MYLTKILDQVLTERDLAPITEKQYRKSIADYSGFWGHPARWKDLNYPSLNAWLRSMKGKLEPQTIRNKTKGISVVWNQVARNGKFNPYHPTKVYKPKVTQKPVVSWTIPELKILLSASDNVKQTDAPKILRALLLVGYDTALRPSDLRLIQWDQIDFTTSTVTLSQSKTKRVHTAMLGIESISALKLIQMPARKKIFPLTKDQMRRLTDKLFAEAEKLDFHRRKGQAIGTLRKLHATVQYEDHGASVAAESLGHVGGIRTVLKHYVDARSIKTGRLPRHIG